jgi:hypothetical protein
VSTKWCLALVVAALTVVALIWFYSYSKKSHHRTKGPNKSHVDELMQVRDANGPAEGSDAKVSLGKPDNVNAICESFTSGSTWIVDDQGALCTTDEYDLSTGCCQSSLDDEPPMVHNVPSSCRQVDMCCAVFEHCIAVCTNIGNIYGISDMMTWMEAIGPKSAILMRGVHSVLDFCVRKCRADSSATLHENAFVSSHRYCYGKHVPSASP